MPQHDPLLRVRHMQDYSREAIALLGTKSLDELHADRTLQLALVQLVGIVGEASTRVPAEIKVQHPSIPWAKAAAMRNRLIHGYDVIDISIVYRTVTMDLPALIEQLKAPLS